MAKIALEQLENVSKSLIELYRTKFRPFFEKHSKNAVFTLDQSADNVERALDMSVDLNIEFRFLIDR